MSQMFKSNYDYVLMVTIANTYKPLLTNIIALSEKCYIIFCAHINNTTYLILMR